MSVIEPIYELFLEGNLIVAVGELSLRTAHKRLIHPVHVPEGGHLLRRWAVVVTMELLHLRLPLSRLVLQYVLVGLVDGLRRLILPFHLLALRALLLVRRPLL